MIRAHPLAGVPPFLVGVATAVAAEVSVGLLLYSGHGLLRAFTLLLVTLLGALALGIWSGPHAGGDRLVEAVRRRWFLALVAYAGGAVTAGVWSVLGGLASAGLTRGLGLAFLAGLPLYGSGAVLASIGAGSPGRGAGVAAGAAAGAAVGAVFTGLALVPSLTPVSMYLFCLIVLSGAALVHGRVLDRSPEERLVDEEPSLFGVVRVRDHLLGSPRRRERRLTVGTRLLGGTEDGRALRTWERALSEWLADPAESGGVPGPVLLVGGGAVTLQERLRAAGRTVVVVERNAVVWRMTVRHFGLPRSANGVRVETGERLEAALEASDDLAAIVADGGGWDDALSLPSASLLRRFRAALGPVGVLAIGGDDPLGLGRIEAAMGLRQLLAEGGFPQVAAFKGVDDRGVGRLLLVAGGESVSLPDHLLEMEGLALAEGPG